MSESLQLEVCPRPLTPSDSEPLASWPLRLPIDVSVSESDKPIEDSEHLVAQSIWTNLLKTQSIWSPRCSESSILPDWRPTLDQALAACLRRFVLDPALQVPVDAVSRPASTHL